MTWQTPAEPGLIWQNQTKTQQKLDHIDEESDAEVHASCPMNNQTQGLSLGLAKMPLKASRKHETSVETIQIEF